MIEGTDVEERSFEDLQLRIDAILPDGRPVWKGIARDRLDLGESPALEDAVEELLHRFPPASAPRPEQKAPRQLAHLEN
jgi:hypothetical protein